MKPKFKAGELITDKTFTLRIICFCVDAGGRFYKAEQLLPKVNEKYQHMRLSESYVNTYQLKVIINYNKYWAKLNA